MIALHLPVYYDALHRGFAPQFVAQYQQWPHMIITEGRELIDHALQTTKSTRNINPTFATKSSPEAISYVKCTIPLK